MSRAAQCWSVALLCAAASATPAFAAVCGPLPVGGYGPYDYRTDRDKAAIVEQYHFTPRVEALLGGATGTIGSDIEYLLERIPNHPRALVSVFRLADRYPSGQINGMKYPVDCYFERALNFRRDDTVVRTLYALYLGKTGRRPAGLEQLHVVAELAGDNPFTQYSLGTAYADLGELNKAAEHARIAQQLGLNKTELIDRLKARGSWPPAASASTAASGSAASASAPASAAH